MRQIIPILATCLCLASLSGCGVTQPARFYILTPVEFGSESAVPGPALGVGPVDFPAYLDRPEIVHRSGDNQLHFADADRWAEPLKTTFTRTLAENLSVMLPSDRISLYPWSRSTRIDYQIGIDVLRFDADANGKVVLVAGWEIIRPDDSTVVSRHRRSYTEAAGGIVYPAIVAAQSRAVERLARDIVTAITAQSAGQ
ncbi:MAG: PqiC family protein [Gammaproteobacteria bacterium]|jgi:hypothetical protein